MSSERMNSEPVSKNKPEHKTPPRLHIESLDHEGRGIAHHDGKVVFVDGALPGEICLTSTYRKKPNFEQAQVVQVVKPSPFRVTPQCRWFGVCGGCSHQHLDEAAQVAVKQRVLEDCFTHIGQVKPESMLSPIHGPTWGYRTRARLSVRNVAKKGGILVGFHERKSSYVADMTSCEVLPKRISNLLLPLRELVAGLSISDRLPQIELAAGEQVDVLVLRILEPLSPDDETRLKAFADRYGNLQFWLQPKGPDTAYPFYPLDTPELAYSLPEFGLHMPFKPTEFTQVNHGINRMLIRRAMRLLDARPGERIADFFCGLGNFSLPIARHGAEVVGIEGSEGLVARAVENAARNGLDSRAAFQVADLFKMTPESYATLGKLDKLLIDPPRDGAIELVKSLPDASKNEAPERIVYVSCSPATLARDAAVLVNQKGYRLVSAGVANMFPHTAHVESIALFVR